MKNKGLFLIFAVPAMSILFTACSNDENEALQSSSDIRFVSQVLATRAATDVQATQLAGGTLVGLFADNDAIGADNAKLTADGSGSLATEGTLKWPASGDVDFYAYAPYAAANSGKLESTISFTVQADQSTEASYIASDLLYASVSQATNGQTVTLPFQHKLAKVIINVVPNDLITLSAPEVQLSNVAKTVEMTVKTGALGEATNAGDVTVHKFTTDDSSYACAAVIAPQTIAAEQVFIIVTNGNGVSYKCALENAKTLQSGYSYIFNVKFEGKRAVLELAYTLTDWTAEGGEGTDLTGQEAVVYGVGDYVTTDGALIKASEVTSSTNLAGVIFSTTVSETDAAAGYTAYVLGFDGFSLTGAKPQNTNDNALTFAANYSAPTSLTAAAADLDGLSHTQYVQGLTDYATNYPAYDLSGLTALDNGTNFSQWFIPSIGQAIQILNNLGEAAIPSSDQKFYAVLPNLNQDPESVPTLTMSGKTYVFSKTPNRTTMLGTIKAITNNTTYLAAQKRYALSSLSGTDIYMMDLTTQYTSSTANSGAISITDTEKADAWGLSSGGATTSRDRFAIVATKLPLK